MMNYASNVVAILITVVVATTSLVRITAGKSITVGGALEWKMPPTDNAYAEWASKETFNVNDVLVFTFFTGSHSVAEVTKAAYDKCDALNVIKVHPMGPVSITLDKTGEKYFFCAVPGHCASGQKLAINVTDGSSSPAPASAPVSTDSPGKSPGSTDSTAQASTGSATNTTKSASTSSTLIPDPLVYLIMLITASGVLIFV